MINVLLTTTICGQLYRVVFAHGCVHSPYAEQNKTALYRQIFNDYYLGRWTFNVIPEYRKNAYPNVERKQRKQVHSFIDERTNRFQYRIAGESKCSKHRRVTKSSDTNSRSTCPWYYVLDYNMQREPQAIAMAKCACKHCLNVGRDGRTTNRCTEVSTYRPVVKWSCPFSIDNEVNFYQYYIDLEKVAVGCTCHMPNPSE
ncbi:hypothetical protein ACF0H5_017851 [Mactra antiquata]